MINKNTFSELKNFTIIGILILIIDYFYLSNLQPFYNRIVKSIQSENINFNLFAAIVCYFLLILVLYYFIIKEKRNILDAFILGVCVYGVFDTTNMAIFKNWPLKAVVIDTLWGGVLFSLVTIIYYKMILKKSIIIY